MTVSPDRIALTASQRSQPASDATEGLAYALSHDLRARLRAATGFLELARADLQEAGDASYFLDRAASAAELADRMVQRLVAYLRLQEAAEVAAIDPAEVIRDAAANLDDGPETVVDTLPLPLVLADRTLLATAVSEILANAAGHRKEDRPPVVSVTGTVEDDWAVLRFVDNGIGISADRVDRAFELFRQVHRVGDNPGSGMGLPIARRCIENLGGAISLRPGSDGGAVVEIRLPVPPGV